MSMTAIAIKTNAVSTGDINTSLAFVFQKSPNDESDRAEHDDGNYNDESK
jgi:hypothetical protein